MLGAVREMGEVVVVAVEGDNSEEEAASQNAEGKVRYTFSNRP